MTIPIRFSLFTPKGTKVGTFISLEVGLAALRDNSAYTQEERNDIVAATLAYGKIETPVRAIPYFQSNFRPWGGDKSLSVLSTEGYLTRPPALMQTIEEYLQIKQDKKKKEQEKEGKDKIDNHARLYEIRADRDPQALEPISLRDESLFGLDGTTCDHRAGFTLIYNKKASRDEKNELATFLCQDDVRMNGTVYVVASPSLNPKKAIKEFNIYKEKKQERPTKKQARGGGPKKEKSQQPTTDVTVIPSVPSVPVPIIIDD